MRGRERESGQGKKERKREGALSWRGLSSSRGGPRRLGGGEQEVATAVSWEPPRTCFSKKTRAIYRYPPELLGFSCNFKDSTSFV
jgi:hypothetical protein